MKSYQTTNKSVKTCTSVYRKWVKIVENTEYLSSSSQSSKPIIVLQYRQHFALHYHLLSIGAEGMPQPSQLPNESFSGSYI